MRISWINLICGTYTDHEWTMCRVTFPGQKVKGQGHRGHRKFGAYPLCSSVHISWMYFISGTNTNHEWTMCRMTFPGQKVKGQGHRGHPNFRACALSKHWFCIQNWLGSAAINCLSVALVQSYYCGLRASWVEFSVLFSHPRRAPWSKPLEHIFQTLLLASAGDSVV